MWRWPGTAGARVVVVARMKRSATRDPWTDPPRVPPRSSRATCCARATCFAGPELAERPQWIPAVAGMTAECVAARRFRRSVAPGQTPDFPPRQCHRRHSRAGGNPLWRWPGTAGARVVVVARMTRSEIREWLARPPRVPLRSTRATCYFTLRGMDDTCSFGMRAWASFCSNMRSIPLRANAEEKLGPRMIL